MAAEVTISRLELITVTDTGAVLTWQTDRPADTQVRYGTQSDRLDQTASGPAVPTRYHCCELTGLKPGTRYEYVCRSGEARASIGPLSPGQFTTLIPPPGKELFRFATMTDTHVGEERTARLVLSGGKSISEGVSWPDPNLPGWKMVLSACVKHINASGAAFTIIKGDVTHGAGGDEFATAKRLLDHLKQPYYVARGNHDNLGPFLRTFGLPESWYGFDREGFHFVILDTEPFAVEDDPALDRQLAWLADDLREHRGQRTFVFVHRPVSPRLNRSPSGTVTNGLFDFGRDMIQKRYGSNATRLLDMASGRRPIVLPKNAIRLAELLREHGRIAGVFAGHLHRNYVGSWPEQTGNLPYVETASTKEYPCGYAITRVFTGGYMQSYYPASDPRVLEWSAMTHDAYAKFGLQIKAGTLADRNFVVRFDKLDMRPRPASNPNDNGTGSLYR
jgi:3',5'-cyclic AMP phosphodiesterase CpdA